MTAYTCPRGHSSAAADYCDECGAAIGGTAASAPEPAGGACPECGTPQSGRFCEVCGYDFVVASLGGTGLAAPPTAAPAPAGSAPAPDPGAPAGGWRLVVRSDAGYHGRMQAQREPDADPIPFPAFCPERRFPLAGDQVLIGRHSRSRGIEPEVDLSGPPADPAVSHAHALLVAQPDGGWAVVDLESANGTYVNESPDAIPAHTPTPLTDGDRVHVGAWTTITIQRIG